MSDLDTRRFRADRPVTALRLAHDGEPRCDLLADTTLLILGGAAGAVTDYRTWTAEGGGLALQIGNDDALTDWLSRNYFVRTAVLIDDDSLSAEAGLALGATIRRLRPDVPVLLLLPPGAPDIAPCATGPSLAIDRRPLTRTGFARAIEVARLCVGIDREYLRPESALPPRLTRVPDPMPDDGAYRSSSGPWLVPMLLGGALAWTLLALMLL